MRYHWFEASLATRAVSKLQRILSIVVVQNVFLLFSKLLLLYTINLVFNEYPYNETVMFSKIFDVYAYLTSDISA